MFSVNENTLQIIRKLIGGSRGNRNWSIHLTR